MKLYQRELIRSFNEKTFKGLCANLPKRGTIFRKDYYSLTITSKKIALGFNIFGKLNAQIEYECNRCLKVIPFTSDTLVDIILCEKYKVCEKQDRDIIFLKKDHDYFNLDSMIADMIELSKPFHPLCNNNCKGLCPECGQDLNCKVCGCKIETSNNPFEELKTLQID